MLDLIDHINWQTLQPGHYRMQAFRHALKTVEGLWVQGQRTRRNAIDYQAIFEPRPPHHGNSPLAWNMGVRPMEILNATSDDWRVLTSKRPRPLSIMLPDSANQSAAGAEQPPAHSCPAADRIERFAGARPIVKALGVEGYTLDESETVEVLSVPPQHASISISRRRRAGPATR